MNNFIFLGSLLGGFDIMFTIVPIFIFIVFIFVITLMFSPKIRAKFLKNQIKATRYMVEEAQEDLEGLASVAIKSKKRIVDANETVLKDMATMNANINKDAVKITAKAIKDGLINEEIIYCKYCGKKIDDDSEFCKYCGKKQNK